MPPAGRQRRPSFAPVAKPSQYVLTATRPRSALASFFFGSPTGSASFSSSGSAFVSFGFSATRGNACFASPGDAFASPLSLPLSGGDAASLFCFAAALPRTGTGAQVDLVLANWYRLGVSELGGVANSVSHPGTPEEMVAVRGICSQSIRSLRRSGPRHASRRTRVHQVPKR